LQTHSLAEFEVEEEGVVVGLFKLGVELVEIGFSNDECSFESIMDRTRQR